MVQNKPNLKPGNHLRGLRPHDSIPPEVPSATGNQRDNLSEDGGHQGSSYLLIQRRRTRAHCLEQVRESSQKEGPQRVPQRQVLPKDEVLREGLAARKSQRCRLQRQDGQGCPRETQEAGRRFEANRAVPIDGLEDK